MNDKAIEARNPLAAAQPARGFLFLSDAGSRHSHAPQPHAAPIELESRDCLPAKCGKTVLKFRPRHRLKPIMGERQTSIGGADFLLILQKIRSPYAVTNTCHHTHAAPQRANLPNGKLCHLQSYQPLFCGRYCIADANDYVSLPNHNIFFDHWRATRRRPTLTQLLVN